MHVDVNDTGTSACQRILTKTRHHTRLHTPGSSPSKNTNWVPLENGSVDSRLSRDGKAATSTSGRVSLPLIHVFHVDLAIVSKNFVRSLAIASNEEI